MVGKGNLTLAEPWLAAAQLGNSQQQPCVCAEGGVRVLHNTQGRLIGAQLSGPVHPLLNESCHAVAPSCVWCSGMVAMIMVRTLYRDISKYNQLDTQEDAAEETGWKLVSCCEGAGGGC